MLLVEVDESVELPATFSTFSAFSKEFFVGVVVAGEPELLHDLLL